MKKTSKFLMAGVIAAVLSAGSANAAPAHNGGHNAPKPHTVVQVQPATHHGHHNIAHHGPHHHPRPQHHHHHHHTQTGDFIIATAILISALM